MKKRINTLSGGSVRYLVFKESDVWYAAGLEFNIVESGSSPEEVMLLLFEALTGYVESAKKIKARPHILNQVPDPEYEKMWTEASESMTARSNIYTFGAFNVGRGRSLAHV